MVLQVGAVRHRLPPALEEDGDALKSVKQAGRTALTEMRHLLGAMRDAGEELELAPSPVSAASTGCSRSSAARAFPTFDLDEYIYERSRRARAASCSRTIRLSS